MVQLREVPTTPGADIVVRRATITLDEQVVYDPAVFEPGREYFVLVGAILGAANAHLGDFTQLGDVVEQAFVSSATFTVAH